MSLAKFIDVCGPRNLVLIKLKTLEAVIRKGTLLTNVTSTVISSYLYIVTNSLGIATYSVMTLSGFCLAAFPLTLARSRPKILYALVTDSGVTSQLCTILEHVMFLKSHLDGCPNIATACHAFSTLRLCCLEKPL